MTVKSSLLFTHRLLFPKTGKNSIAQKSLLASLLCIGISIVPLIVVFTVSNGMIYGMTERIIGLSSSHLEVVTRTSESADELRSFAKSFEGVNGVIASYPEVTGSALVASARYRSGALLRAIEKNMFIQNKDFKNMFTLIEGSYENFDSHSAIIGKHIADTLHIGTGDSFRIISAQQAENGNFIPKASAFKVCAVVSSGYQELDSLWVFIPLDIGFSIMAKNEKTVRIETEDAFSPNIVRIQNDCQEIAFSDFASVYRWDELNKTQYENFSSTKVMLVFVMLLIVLVACVNISSALVMLVMERRREIAVLKSLGGKPSGITLSFLLTGLVIGFFGLLLGFPIGLLFSVNINGIINFFEKIVNFCLKIWYILLGHNQFPMEDIRLLDPAYYLSEIPVIIPFKELFFIALATILLSLLVSVIPAKKAGAERVLEIFRKV